VSPKVLRTFGELLPGTSLRARYGDGVFERFTERARQVVVFAQEEARGLRHNYIGREHILLGLLREEEGPAAQILESFDVTLEKTREAVARIVGEGDEVTTGQIPFTPRAKKALQVSATEPNKMGHNYVGTEHILLGLLRANDGVAAKVIGVDPERIRSEVLRRLSGPRASLARAQWRLWPAPLLIGWALGLVAGGIGLLVGWLIWG
jgi:ATP-dependent Clp protease ATP-binding subunit ClpC